MVEVCCLLCHDGSGSCRSKIVDTFSEVLEWHRCNSIAVWWMISEVGGGCGFLVSDLKIMSSFNLMDWPFMK